jgi:hypothetical protein
VLEFVGESLVFPVFFAEFSTPALSSLRPPGSTGIPKDGPENAKRDAKLLDATRPGSDWTAEKNFPWLRTHVATSAEAPGDGI